jgi:AcrR family transcriptional regulator
MDETEPNLPRGIALSWGIAERPQKGPKRELSLEGIIDTAIEIADAEGLGAVSMARVSSSLGFTTMSLYRYVTSKDELVQLMQNAASVVLIPPLDESQDWRDGLREWSASVHGVYRRHPWLLDIRVESVPLSPSDLAMVDWAMRILRDLPLSQGEKMSTLLLLSGYTRSVGLLERDLTATDPVEVSPEHRAALRQLVTEELFPHLYPIVQSGVYTGDGATAEDADEDASFGLERILDGVERYVTEKAAGRLSPAVPPASEPYPHDKAVAEAVKARREAEKKVREALKRERELVKVAREREKNAHQKEQNRAAAEARKAQH